MLNEDQINGVMYYLKYNDIADWSIDDEVIKEFPLLALAIRTGLEAEALRKGAIVTIEDYTYDNDIYSD